MDTSSQHPGTDGRVEGFARLFVEHRRRIQSFILTFVPNWDDAEEIEQRTAIVLWQKFEKFDPATNFGAWACQVARLEVMNFRRVQSRARVAFSDDLVREMAIVRSTLDSTYENRSQALSQCIKTLSASDLELVRMCYGSYQMKPGVIAQHLGKSINTVHQALSRVRRRLANCVRHRIADEGRL